MDTSRAREQLDWRPQHDSREAFLELFEGLHAGSGLATPPLDPGTAGPLRLGELATGVGVGSRATPL